MTIASMLSNPELEINFVAIPRWLALGRSLISLPLLWPLLYIWCSGPVCLLIAGVLNAMEIRVAFLIFALGLVLVVLFMFLVSFTNPRLSDTANGKKNKNLLNDDRVRQTSVCIRGSPEQIAIIGSLSLSKDVIHSYRRVLDWKLLVGGAPAQLGMSLLVMFVFSMTSAAWTYLATTLCIIILLPIWVPCIFQRTIQVASSHLVFEKFILWIPYYSDTVTLGEAKVCCNLDDFSVTIQGDRKTVLIDLREYYRTMELVRDICFGKLGRLSGQA